MICKELDLFLDESGDFREMGHADGDAPGKGKRFPSQLAGVLAPKGTVTPDTAGRLLRRCLERAGVEVKEEFHSTEQVRKGQAMDTLVQALVFEMRHLGWQPVRLVNQEGVSFGDRVATYAQMVAELVLRVHELEKRQGAARVTLRLKLARVFWPGEDERPDRWLQKEDYLKRLREAVAFLAVRQGLCEAHAGLEVAEVKLGSGRSWPELQVCDLVSNASHDDFTRLGKDARDALSAALAPYDFSLAWQPALEHVDYLMTQGMWGAAVQSLVEQLFAEDGRTSVQMERSVRNRLRDATRRLAALSATARAHHLDVLTGWVEQLIEHDRRLSLADRVLYLLHDEVLGSMEHHLDEPTEAATLAPFAFALQRQALTLANHHGDLETAERCSTEVDRLIPTLAGRWEHAHLVVDGLTAQAVALSDRFEHEAACARMEAVAGYYDAIASLFRDALPDVFPATVRSERRGRALGTWLQAECMAGLAQPERLVRARTISDEALEEFSAPGERARQYQYRCQLETWAGDPERARHYLALGIGAAGDDHRAMATRIEALDHQSRGFPLLHWLRIGAWATLHQPESPELSEFNSAFGRSSLRYDTWLREGRLHYPAHGIRRSAAVVAAGRGDLPDALALLGALRNLEPLARGEVPLALVLGSACLEVAALLRNRAPDRTRDLLHGSRGKPGVTQVIAWLDHLEKIDIPAVRTLSRRWQEVVDEAPGLDPNALKRKLIDMARPVGY